MHANSRPLTLITKLRMLNLVLHQDHRFEISVWLFTQHFDFLWLLSAEHQRSLGVQAFTFLFPNMDLPLRQVAAS